MENKFDWLENCYQTYYDDWLKNRTFRKTAWIGDSHTHCLFDAKRISNYDIEDKQEYDKIPSFCVIKSASNNT